MSDDVATASANSQHVLCVTIAYNKISAISTINHVVLVLQNWSVTKSNIQYSGTELPKCKKCDYFALSCLSVCPVSLLSLPMLSTVCYVMTVQPHNYSYNLVYSTLQFPVNLCFTAQN